MADNKIILTSPKNRVDLRDLGKGFVIAVLGTAVFAIQYQGDKFFETLLPFLKTIDPTLKVVVMAGISSGVGYLAKKLREDQKVMVDPSHADVVVKTQEPADTHEEAISIQDSSSTKE